MKQIQRKFVASGILLEKIPLIGIGKNIEQGYILSQEGVELRIRRGDHECTMTVKGKGAMVRDEWTTELPSWVFDTLADKVTGKLLKKVRHSVFCENAQMEIDIFTGVFFGLLILECKFEDEESAKMFELPDWAKSAIDVTDDKQYQNRELALHPEAITI